MADATPIQGELQAQIRHRAGGRRVALSDVIRRGRSPATLQAGVGMHAGADAHHSHHEMPTSGRALTQVAMSATLHCVTGCAIREIDRPQARPG